jgi:hypothetical protein
VWEREDIGAPSMLNLTQKDLFSFLFQENKKYSRHIDIRRHNIKGESRGGNNVTLKA